MAKFPEPPSVARLQGIAPETVALKVGERVYRVFKTGGPHPSRFNDFRYYGPTSSRFDHHIPDPKGNAVTQPRGIMYGAVGADAIPTCLAEAFQGNRVIECDKHAPVLCSFSLVADLTLLDLSGPFATRIGASMAINTDRRSRARRWAQHLYLAYPKVQGIYYASSMYANKPAIALFEHAANAIPVSFDTHRPLSDPLLKLRLEATAPRIGYLVI